MTREERLERMIKAAREYERAYSEICDECKAMASEACKKPQSKWPEEAEKIHEKMSDAAYDLGNYMVDFMVCGDKIPAQMLPMFDQMLFAMSKATALIVNDYKKKMASGFETRGESIDDIYDNFWDGVEE